MNLIDFGFQNSNLFSHMPLFDSVSYKGHKEGKVRQYTAVREDQECCILTLNIIRQEEKILWTAAEDFLKRSTQNAGYAVHGNYIFDLLTIDIHKEIDHFDHNELMTMLVNVSRRLQPGARRMIKYSSSYGILQKLSSTDWGKITFKTSVDVFKDKPEYLDLLIKRLLKDFSFPRHPVILLLNDLSQHPLFDPANEHQQDRLRRRMDKLIPESIAFIPEVYVRDHRGARELLSGSEVI
jgi:hypothetical protein